MTTPQNISSVGRGAIWSLLDNSARQFLALLVFLITARFVSVEAFGIMAVSLLVVEVFKQTVIDSVGTAITSISKPEDEDYNASFLIILCTSLLSALIVFLSADLFARIFGNDDIASALRLVCFLLASIGLSRTHEAWLSRHLKFKTLALRSLASIIMGGGVGIFMAVKGYGLMALIMQQLVITFVSTTFLWIGTPWKPAFKTSRAKVVRLLKFSKHTMVTGIATIANTQSDVFFSSYYLGEAATGIYNAAKRITTAMNAVLAISLNRVALPVLSNMQEDSARTSQAYLKAVLFTAMIIAPIYAGIALTSKDLIMVLLGEKWISSAQILSILCISSFLASIEQYNNVIFLVKNKPHWQSFLMTLYAVTNIILLLIFARYGLMALALSFTARSIMFFPVSLVAALRLLKLPILSYIKTVMPTIMATAIMLVVLDLGKNYIHHDNSIINLLVTIPLGAAVYLISYAIFDLRSIKALLLEIKVVVKGS